MCRRHNQSTATDGSSCVSVQQCRPPASKPVPKNEASPSLYPCLFPVSTPSTSPTSPMTNTASTTLTAMTSIKLQKPQMVRAMPSPKRVADSDGRGIGRGGGLPKEGAGAGGGELLDLMSMDIGGAGAEGELSTEKEPIRSKRRDIFLVYVRTVASIAGGLYFSVECLSVSFFRSGVVPRRCCLVLVVGGAGCLWQASGFDETSARDAVALLRVISRGYWHRMTHIRIGRSPHRARSFRPWTRVGDFTGDMFSPNRRFAS